MQFARINGVTLHHQLITAGPAKPRLVFINSLGTDFRIWRDVVVRLAGDFSILCYDKRGHGLSDVGETSYAVDTFAQDVAELIEHTQFGPALVCAMSVGGLVAQALWARRPDLVSGLVFCDTAARIGTTAGWNERISRVEAGGLESVADGIVAGWLSDAFLQTPDAAGYRNMLVRQPVAGYLGTVTMLRDTDLGGVAETIDVPTVCLVGDEDVPTPPAQVEAFAATIPGARFETIPGTRHLPPIEKPDIVADLIRSVAALTGERHVKH